MNVNWKRFLAFVILALTSGPATFAQLQSGRVVGTVFDPQRAAVPGASVTVTDIGTNVAKRVVTDNAGDYVVTPLNPGTYNVSVASPGFQTTLRRGIELEVGQAIRIDLQMQLGETNTTVEITADIPLLNTETGTLGQVITNTQIVNLPLNGRSFHELARMAPGAALLAATGNVQKVRPELVNGNVISGVRGSQTTFLLDGADITEQHQGGTWIQTSIDALQEFRVEQNSYSAEFARAGGSFNATTKSGSNDLHGALFEFLRNDKLDARNTFSPKREVLKRNQYGATLGGPVFIPGVYNGRNSTFFFVSFESNKERQGLVFNNTVPTLAQRSGDFSAPGLNRIYDALTTAPNPAGGGNVRTLFAGNIIPASRLSPAALYFNKYIPAANSANGQAVFTPTRAFNADQFTLKGDRVINSNHRLFARVSLHYNNQDDPDGFPALGTAHLSGPAQNFTISLISNLRSDMVHEFRHSYLTGQYRSEAYFQGQGTTFNKEAGITGLESSQDPVISSLPAVSWSGLTGFSGTGGDGRPKWQDRWAWEFTDSLTWIKRKHIVKFGTRIHYFKPLFTDARTNNGSFSFTGIGTENPASTAGTGDAFADWMAGYPASGGRSNPATWWGGYGTYWHFFAQDDFKVSSRLTLNLGVRYEYTPFLKGYRGQVATFDPTLAKSIIVAGESNTIDLESQPLAKVGYSLFGDLIQTSSQAGLPINLSYTDKRQFAPRFGLAWRPFNDTTVLRGGYGIFYESEGTSSRLNFNFLPWRLSESVSADRGVTPTRTTANFFLGVPFGSSVGAASWLPTALRMRMGYDQHWNFGIQNQLWKTTVVEVNYVGNKGSFLNGSDHINHPPAAAGNIQARRPYPRFGTISYSTMNVSSTYHSLQAKVERRLSAGLWVLVSYTFSKSLWHEANPGVGGNTGWEKALASFDTPQNIATSFGYELPFGKGKAFLGSAGRLANGLLGGWQLQSIVGFRSGLPYTPSISRDAANNGVGGQRPNRIGSGKLANPTLDVYFDKTAFVLPANFTFGNSGGGILRRDYLGGFDLSLSKQFSVTENSRLQFRAEVFNIPNAVYYGAPSTNIDVATGGRVTSVQNVPRQIQFGLKYNF